MTWHARLELVARRDATGRCTVHAAHEGPLRVLKTLYPEGGAIAHQVIVHPPGGIVGGDHLNLDIELQQGTHLLLTTPGATRFYRSAGQAGVQQLRARLAPARGWSGCRSNRSRTPAASASTMRASSWPTAPR